MKEKEEDGSQEMGKNRIHKEGAARSPPGTEGGLTVDISGPRGRHSHSHPRSQSDIVILPFLFLAQKGEGVPLTFLPLSPSFLPQSNA